jgi:Class III cytochrome C family
MTVMTMSRVGLIAICGPFLLAALCAGGRVSAQAPKEPDSAVLTGAPLGPVTFTHKAHTKTYGAKCESCHHPSKPEKPLKGEHQKCTDCHVKTPAAPMKTKTQAAFHDPMAKKGTCVDCHVQAAAKGNKKVPAKCADCHKKA